MHIHDSVQNDQTHKIPNMLLFFAIKIIQVPFGHTTQTEEAFTSLLLQKILIVDIQTNTG